MAGRASDSSATHGVEDPGLDRAPVEIDPQVAATVVDTAVNPFALVDPEGTFRWASASIREVLGFTPDELVGRSVLDLVDPGDRAPLLDALATAEARTRSGAPDSWEGDAPTLDLATAHGSVLRCQVAVATSARTGIDGFVVQIRRAGGIGWLHEALAAMAEGRDVRTVVTHLVAMAERDLSLIRLAVGWDWDGERFLHAEGGPTALDLTHRWAAVAPWSTPTAGARRIDVAALPEPLRSAAAQVGAGELWLRDVGEGEDRAVVAGWHLASWPMTGFTAAALERVARLVGVALDWDRDRRAVTWAAHHDALTGLANRPTFLDHLARSARHATTVLYLDLDDFKPVNDRHGHAHGDRVLTEVAGRLRRVVRPEDVVARIGGDEFAVLCPGLTDEAAAERLAQRLVDAVGEPIDLGGVTVTVGLSAGIIGVLDGGHDPDELLVLADDALREAKASGKHRWQRAVAPGASAPPDRGL